MSRIDTRTYGRETCLHSRSPWGIFVGGRVMCSDGKVRALKRISSTADTFFSVPASVQVRGATVSGFVTFETEQGWSTETPDDPAVAKFVAKGVNRGLLPDGAWKSEAA